jgi:hypothetical protein
MSVFTPRAGAQLTIVFDGRGAPNKTFTLDHVIPKTCKVSRNGYHEADTWHMEFDARILPLDPEGIASIAASVYMWDSGGDEKKEWQLEENEMITGLADEDSIEIGKDQHLVCSGRDFTSVLDVEWDTRIRVPSGITLDKAVQFVADKAAPAGTTARFKVLWEASEDPVISAGAARSTKRKGMWIKPGKTTWEVIYDLCIQHGFIVFIRGSTIHISDPRTQTDESLTKAPRFIYGRDVMNFTAHRKLAKERVPQIKLVYWDAKTRQKFEVLYPPRGQKLTTGLGLKKNEVETLPAPAYCHDRASALRFAKMRWELLARSETSYKIETRHLRLPRVGFITAENGQTVAFDESDFDLLRLREGDAVGLAFDPFLGDTMRALDFAGRVGFLQSLGYKPALCYFVATNIDRLEQFRQPYYTRRVDYSFDQKDGMTIEIEAVNFAYERREIAFADSFDPTSAAIQPDAVTGVQ